MGILGFLDSPETLSALMGIPATGPVSTGPPPQPPPQAPPQTPPQDGTPLPPSNVMASADPNFAPNSTVGANALNPPQAQTAPIPPAGPPPTSLVPPAQPLAPPPAAAPGPQAAIAPAPMPAPRPPQPYQVAPSATDLPQFTSTAPDQKATDDAVREQHQRKTIG
jgi:hypothetical protein